MNAPAKTAHEPLFHVVKRDTLPLSKALLIRAAAIVFALLFVSVLSVFLIKANPIEFIGTLFEGTFGTARRLWKFAKDSAVLLCIALAITPAFRMKFWNIGAEGQTLVGALAAVAVAYYGGSTIPNGILLLLMFIAAVLAGAIWGGIPAVFKAKWNTNETLFTLMMNYVASGLVAYFLLLWTPSGSSVLGELPFGHIPMLSIPKGAVFLTILIGISCIVTAITVVKKLRSHSLNKEVRFSKKPIAFVKNNLSSFKKLLPVIGVCAFQCFITLRLYKLVTVPAVFEHEYLLLILAVLLLTVLVYIYLQYTKQGYEISVVGESENTARYIGIGVGKVIIRTMIVSGAICGIAGFLIVGALDHSVTPETVGGMGFTAIMVSWLAKFNPLIMIGTSALITFLEQGASQITTNFNIDSAFPDMMIGIVLFFIIGCEFFISYRLKFRESEKKGGSAQ